MIFMRDGILITLRKLIRMSERVHAKGASVWLRYVEPKRGNPLGKEKGKECEKSSSFFSHSTRGVGFPRWVSSRSLRRGVVYAPHYVKDLYWRKGKGRTSPPDIAKVIKPVRSHSSDTGWRPSSEREFRRWPRSVIDLWRVHSPSLGAFLALAYYILCKYSYVFLFAAGFLHSIQPDTTLLSSVEDKLKVWRTSWMDDSLTVWVESTWGLLLLMQLSNFNLNGIFSSHGLFEMQGTCSRAYACKDIPHGGKDKSSPTDVFTYL